MENQLHFEVEIGRDDVEKVLVDIACDVFDRWARRPKRAFARVGSDEEFFCYASE